MPPSATSRASNPQLKSGYILLNCWLTGSYGPSNASLTIAQGYWLPSTTCGQGSIAEATTHLCHGEWELAPKQMRHPTY